MKRLVRPIYNLEPLCPPENNQSHSAFSLPKFDPLKLRSTFCALENAVRQACQIHKFLRQNNSAQGLAESNSSELNSLLDRLQMTVSQIPLCTPGGNSLVWVMFVAASSSTKLDHAAFFTSRLAELMRRFGFDDTGDIML